MPYYNLSEMTRSLEPLIEFEKDRLFINDVDAFREQFIDRLLRSAVFGSSDVKKAAIWIIWAASQALGCGAASIGGLAHAMKRGELQGFTIPDPNLPWEKDIMMHNILLVLSMAVVSLVIPFLGVKFLIPHLPRQMQVISTATMKSAHASSVQESHPEITAGTRGQSATMLRPAGKIIIGKRRYEASAISGFIDPGQSIEVISVSGNKITVKELT